MSLVVDNRILYSGNEAVARGAADAGVRVATAYPGTPSTEILENIVQYEGIDAEWSPNEKVALEVGMGAAFAGARTLVTMKHVGVNVAADPLFTMSYTGTRGGLVLVSADDPGMHSSQNEQDNRFYAPFAKVPMLEPSDSQDAYDYVRLAFDISEQFDTPVILRMTTRVCHAKSIVQLGEGAERKNDFAFTRDRQKLVMIPAYARKRHAVIEERTEKLAAYNETLEANLVEDGDRSLGILTSGVSYLYVKDVLPDARCMKLAMTHPLPKEAIERFAASVDKLVVVEELEPYLENQLRLWGIPVEGKPKAMRLGELSPDRLKDMFGIEHVSPVSETAPPPRPPVLCPGCPHRGVYVAMRKLKPVVTGDIGCYTLGVLPPLEQMDTCVCMGAGISHALGLSKVLPKECAREVIAVIGDSTFVHSGITPLIDIVYNGGNCTIVILDNGTTAMTGRQDHPATGKTLMGEEAPVLDMVGLCTSIGVRHVNVVDPWNVEEVETALKAAMDYEGPAVVIARGDCVLRRTGKAEPLVIKEDECRDCGLCAKSGCPAIEKVEGGYRIDTTKCGGCGLCQQLCRFGAIGAGMTC